MRNRLGKILVVGIISIMLVGTSINLTDSAKLPTRNEVLYSNRNKPKSKFQKIWSKAFEPLNCVLDKIDKW